MSEQVEIEIGANLTKFNAGMANVRNSVQRISGTISRLDFSQSDRSMSKLKDSSKESARQANTLAGLMRTIANTKVDSRTIKDFQEIVREILRIVKELGPVLTLAMNAVDKPIRNAILSFGKLFTEIERTNSNFLVLRKVLPIRLFTSLAINAQRVSTSISGMKNDFKDFGSGSASALRKAGEGLKNVGTRASQAKAFIGDFVKRLDPRTSQTFRERLNGIATAFGNLRIRTRTAVTEINKAEGVQKKISISTQQLKGALSGLASAFVSSTQGSRTLEQKSATLRTAFSRLNDALKQHNAGQKVTKVATMTTAVALRTLGASVGLAGRAFSSLGTRLSQSGFKAFANNAQRAIAPIKAVGGGVRNIATRPIQSAGKALGGLAKMGSIAGLAITSVVGAFRVFTGLLSSSASGGVATFNKNFRKAMAELPSSAQSSFGEVRKQILALQNEMGFTSDQALPALQSAFRKGFDADNAVGAVRQAMQLAKTGATDLEGAIDILGNSMRAFSREGLSASETSDALFRATRGVDVNMGSLSESIRRLGPELSSTGLGFQDFLGSLKTLTQQGRMGATAIGEIRTLTASIVSPSDQAREAMEKLGLNFSKADMAGRGLGAILQEVKNATGGSAQAMAEVLGGQENLNTALLLGAQNGTRLAKNMDEIANSTGSVASQADKMDTAFSRAMKKLSARTETLKIQLGDLLKPLVARLGEFLSEWTATFTKAIKVAMALFEGGNLGEVLFLGIKIGLQKAIVGVLNFATGVQKAISRAFVNGVLVLPKAVGQIIPNVLARLGKIGFFFIELGAQFVRAFETPIAYLTAGLKKAIEEASEALSKLPFLGDDKASKARAFDVILKQELQNKGELGRNIQGFATRGFKNAEAIIKRTDGALTGFLEGNINALKEGFAEGAKTFEIPDSTKRDQKKMTDLLREAYIEVNKAGDATAKMAKDAQLEAGIAPVQAVGSDGEGGSRVDQSVVASSLAEIGGGGGVFGSMTSIAKESLNVAKQMLEQAKMQTRQLGEMDGGKVMQ